MIALEIEHDGYIEEICSPEERLWRAVLASLLDDAMRFWQGRRAVRCACPPVEQERVFNDILECGEVLRHVCSFSGHDPEAVRDAFVRWCEANG